MRGVVYAQSKMAGQPWITTLEGIIQFCWEIIEVKRLQKKYRPSLMFIESWYHVFKALR